jgi:hypothetical protein
MWPKSTPILDTMPLKFWPNNLGVTWAMSKATYVTNGMQHRFRHG